MCDDALESSSKELRRVVSSETLLNFQWTIPFTVHNDASDKQVGAVISQKNKRLPSSQNIEQSNSVTTLRLRGNFS